MKRVAIIGTQGVPAEYGGFETLVENIIGDNCSEDIEYTVFCSSKNKVLKIRSYKGTKLKYVPVNANGMQSTLFDMISMIRSMRGYDIVLVLGVSGGLFFPFFRLFCRKKLIANIDGLEWKRGKWGKFAKNFLRISETLAVRFSNVVIADNQAIVDYIQNKYKKESVLIAYGGDHVKREISKNKQDTILENYNVERGQYSISICRIEPENNCDLILEAFSHSDKRLIFIGNWNINSYGQRLKAKYSLFNNISIVDPQYDLDILYALRSNCEYYIHGHSAGGTNPSLVESMFCKCNIMTYDVIYNRITTENQAHFFRDKDDLLLAISGKNNYIRNAQELYDVAKKRYIWNKIAKQYEALYCD